MPAIPAELMTGDEGEESVESRAKKFDGQCTIATDTAVGVIWENVSAISERAGNNNG